MHLFIRKNIMIDNVLNDQIKTGVLVYPLCLDLTISLKDTGARGTE